MSEIRPEVDQPEVQTSLQESNSKIVSYITTIEQADEFDLKYLCVSEYAEETVKKNFQTIRNELFRLFGIWFPYIDNNSERQHRKEARKLYIDKLIESKIVLQYEYYSTALVKVIVSWKGEISDFRLVSNKQKTVRKAYEALLGKLNLWPIPDRPMHYSIPTPDRPLHYSIPTPDRPMHYSIPTSAVTTNMHPGIELKLEYLLEPDNFELTRNEIFSLFDIWSPSDNNTQLYKEICDYYVDQLNKTNAKVEYTLDKHNSNILMVKVSWKGVSAECKIVKGKQKAARDAFIALLHKLQLPVSECPKVMPNIIMVPVYKVVKPINPEKMPSSNSSATICHAEKNSATSMKIKGKQTLSSDSLVTGSSSSSREKEISVTNMQIASDNISLDTIRDFTAYKEYVYQKTNINYKEKVLNKLYILFNLIHDPKTPIKIIKNQESNDNCVLGFQEIQVEQPEFYWMILKTIEKFPKDNTSNKTNKISSWLIYELLRQIGVSPVKHTRGPEEHDPGSKVQMYSTRYVFNKSKSVQNCNLYESKQLSRYKSESASVSTIISTPVSASVHMHVPENTHMHVPVSIFTPVSGPVSVPMHVYEPVSAPIYTHMHTSVQTDFHNNISVMLENTRNEITKNKTSDPVSAHISVPAHISVHVLASTHIPKVAETEVKVTESEVKALCDKLETMRTKLKQYIKKEVEDKATKERKESEDKAKKEARIKFQALHAKLETMYAELDQYKKTEKRGKSYPPQSDINASESEDCAHSKKKTKKN